MEKRLKSIEINFKDGTKPPSMVAMWWVDEDGHAPKQVTSRIEGAGLQRVLGLSVEEITSPTDPVGSVLTHVAALLDEGKTIRKALRFSLNVIDATTAERVDASLLIRNAATGEVLFDGVVPPHEVGQAFAHVETQVAVHTEVVVSADGYHSMTLSPKLSRGGRLLTVRLNPL
jgi:hypothetical protein